MKYTYRFIERRQRLTYDKPEDNYENCHNLAFVKDRSVVLRGMGENNEDICIVEYFVRNICRKECGENIYDGEIPQPEDFDCTDCAIFGCDYAMFYNIAIGSASLREKLKNYEDLEEQGRLQILPFGLEVKPHDNH